MNKTSILLAAAGFAVTATTAMADDKPQLAFVVNAASDFWKLAEAGVNAAQAELPQPALTTVYGDLHVGGNMCVDGEIIAAKGLRTPGADMAELYKVADGEAVKPRQVIGLQLRKGEVHAISLQTGDAHQVGVVSENPAVCGNANVAPSPDSVAW